MIKNSVQKFGKFLSSMVMPNIGAFIAWGFITALFIDVGWIPNENLATLVSPMITYLLPLLIGITGGKMINGDRGAVIAAISVIGVIVGSDVTMFIGAMVMGPLSGYIIKKFDKAVANKIPAGFEMLVNNFSIGIIGMILSILGFYTIGPFISAITGLLGAGVAVIVKYGLLPLVAIFIEPAKILFLNNAINHGILSPIGAEQAIETGKSIMYMLEANPGPGLGVLLAYWFFSKGTAKSSAPGAVIIHFFGGIHEIYFPYVLMNPMLIIAPILGSMGAIFFYAMFDLGLVGPASPGSIIAFLAMAPKGQTLPVLIGVLISTAISLLVASIIIKVSNKDDLDIDKAKEKVKSMKLNKTGELRKIVFACDAGMGSSAMGATKFKNRIKKINPTIEVINTSVDNIPNDIDIVVCQVILKDRAMKSAPNAQLITINNFLDDENLDSLFKSIEEKSDGEQNFESLDDNADEKISSNGITINKDAIKLSINSKSKEEAIIEAGELLVSLGYVNSDYTNAMLKREEIVSTCIGYGVAIPHGVSETKKDIIKTGIVLLQYPNGVKFGDEEVNLVIGIAGVGDEHLDLLAKISTVIEDADKLQKLKTTNSVDEILNILK